LKKQGKSDREERPLIISRKFAKKTFVEIDEGARLAPANPIGAQRGRESDGMTKPS